MSTQADETTDRIRAAALALFAERGYGNTTIEHISTAADVGVATIYRRWADKAAIANDLYGLGLDSMDVILAEPEPGEPREQFIEIWNRAWSWATANRDMFAFINASLGAPWLTPELAARKATMTEAEVGTYSRFEIDAAPDFAAALIGGALMSILAMEPDVEPDEVGARLWRALKLDAD
ncbi:MAG: TetR/AcrR family transcriptional regulator [Actinomycetota bacterium]